MNLGIDFVDEGVSFQCFVCFIKHYEVFVFVLSDLLFLTVVIINPQHFASELAFGACCDFSYAHNNGDDNAKKHPDFTYQSDNGC